MPESTKDTSERRCSEEGRLGVVSVLFGAATIPSFLDDLRQGGADVVVIDNSGDLLVDREIDGLTVLRPGQNLGYPAAINLGVATLLGRTEVSDILLVNPDMTLQVDFIDSLRSAAALGAPAISFPDIAGGPTVGWQPRPSSIGSALAYGFRLHRFAYLGRAEKYPSGSLLLIERQAVALLTAGRDLLVPELFFMDDVELADRARAAGISLVPVRGTAADVTHESNGTGWRAPGVPYFFRRVSKVRYWSGRRHRVGAALLAVVIMLEAAAVITVTTFGRATRLGPIRGASRLLLASIGGYRRSHDAAILSYGYHRPATDV